MITLAELKIWLERKLKQAFENERIVHSPTSKTYRAAISSLTCNSSAQQVAHFIRAWACSLPREPENRIATETSESIARFIEATYTWDIYLHGIGLQPSTRVEGPFLDRMQAVERVMELWQETRRYHIAVLIGSLEEQRIHVSMYAR